MVNINEVVSSLESYSELEERINDIMNPEVLKENVNYRALINLETELKNYILNGGEIIEIYRNVKNSIEQKYNFKEEEYKSKIEEEYKSKINNLEEVVSNLKNYKNNLKNLISDSNNFFNGKIVEEIKKED